MIQYIAELNRVLLMAKAISLPEGIELGALIEQCKSFTIEGRMPDHEATINFSIELGLLKWLDNHLLLITEEGEVFLQFNTDEIYDLSVLQRKYLLRNFFFDGKFKKEAKKCLRCFVPSDREGTFVWSSVDGIPFGNHEWVVSHLEQLGLLLYKDDGYIVEPKYIETVSAFINETSGFSEDELFKWLAEKKKLGDIAEKLILDFERKRLHKLGHNVESNCVRLVSKVNTKLGYDIESYNAKSDNMSFDRFIEVKGSGSPSVRFVWSSNEIEIAKKLKERYWIYYQGGINKKSGMSDFEPLMFQDPYNSIPLNTNLSSVENGLVVSGPISGRRINKKQKK